MPDLPPAHRLIRKPETGARVPSGRVVLGYDERFLRRKRLMTEDDEGFLVDLPETTSVSAGDCFELLDGRLIEVGAAAEPVLVVTGENLARLAWHIGNRHTPCQIGADRLVIRDDHVLKAMLVQLGATVGHAMEPFTPEGGAYGHGRTMGHDHGGHDHLRGPVLTLPHGLGGLHVHHHGMVKVEDEPEAPDE
ncbi:urease accessory protein UreE [Paragemmobacter straminiformis]|uniref:Urease accessory protein UreE n=1 Tax=Paragemmobacter straminiformis TaxID=2045119 RepID=A0A842IAG8_9RHOB|nr:urease accessory protein UreE [Gemmobacter straminiformis]MBC2836596.1 urease accessory protein UreE [Gemmobacter straminiformis]